MTKVVAIGVSEYQLDSIAHPLVDLPFAVSDAERFAATLARMMLVDDCSVLVSGSGPLLASSRNNILANIVGLLREDHDPAIVYFAGHAIEAEGALHLCPEDFDPRIPALSGVPVATVIELLSRRACWSLIVLDSCRIHTTDRSHRRRTEPPRLLVADNVSIFLACSSGERAFEAPSIHGQGAGGVFTHFLLGAVEHDAVGHEPVCLGKAFKSAQDATSIFVASTFEASQTPRSIGQDPAELFLTKTDYS